MRAIIMKIYGKQTPQGKKRALSPVIIFTWLVVLSSVPSLCLYAAMNAAGNAVWALYASEYLLPLIAAIFLPYQAAKCGVNAMAAFFPPFLMEMLLPPLFQLRPLWSVVGIQALCGIISACAGMEIRKRSVKK